MAQPSAGYLQSARAPVTVARGDGGTVCARRTKRAGSWGQAEISLASWLLIDTLRGLAASCTGIVKVSTPAV